MGTGGGRVVPASGALSFANVGKPFLDMDPDSLAGADLSRVASFPNRADLSAYTFVQAIAGAQPKLALNAINGHKALLWDANYCLEGPAAANLQVCTIIAVVNHTVIGGGGILGPYSQPSVSGPGFAATNASPAGVRVIGGGGTMGSSSGTFPLNTWALVGASLSFNRIHFRINGAGTFDTTSSGNISQPDRLCIGETRNAAAGAQDPWRGYIARILAWKRVLEDWEWLLADREMNTHFGLGLTLTSWS